MWGGINFLEPVLTLFYLHQGLTNQEIFFVLLSFSLSILIFEVPTGAFADRYGAKSSFVVGGIVRLLSVITLLVADGPIFLYVSQVLAGLSATFFSGAEEALLYESLKTDQREKEMAAVMGRIQSASMIPMIIGLLLGAYLGKDLTQWQFQLLIVIRLISVLIQFFFSTQVIEPDIQESYRDHPFHHVRKGWAEIIQSPRLLTLFANFTIIFIPTYVFTTFDQPLFQELGIPVATFGLIYASASFLAYFATKYIGKYVPAGRESFAMQVTGWVIFASYVLILFVANNALVAILVAILIRVTRSIRFPLYSQLSNEYISSGSRATSLSLLSVLDSVFDLVLLLSIIFTVSEKGLFAILMGCAIFTFIGNCFPVTPKRQPENSN